MKMILKGQMSGRFKLDVIRPDGSKRSTGWFDNLILDSGLNHVGTKGIGSFAQVGSGSATPLAANTSLQSWIAGTSGQIGQTEGASPTAPYYGWCRRSFRFAAGVAAGNLAEVGIGWGNTGSTLFSRALIRDGLGDPTVLTVLSDEVLDVTYELRCYAPTADVNADIVIDGVTYATVTRAIGVTSAAQWGTAGMLNYGSQSAGAPNGYAYDGDLAAVTADAPDGTFIGVLAGSILAYSNNSLKRRVKVTAALDVANTPGGIKSVLWYNSWPYAGNYQTSFTPKIPKDNTKVLTLTFEHQWARRP